KDRGAVRAAADFRDQPRPERPGGRRVFAPHGLPPLRQSAGQGNVRADLSTLRRSQRFQIRSEISGLCVPALRSRQAAAARLRAARSAPALHRFLQLPAAPARAFRRAFEPRLEKLFRRGAGRSISERRPDRAKKESAMIRAVKGVRIEFFIFLLAALSALCACSTSPELVSEVVVEDKIARLRLGQSDKTEVESIFGVDHGNDRNRWAYYFSDRQFEISERQQGPGLGALPIAAGVVPVNTRALVVVTFNEAGVAKRIEVARFFEEPFINEYWYLIKGTVKEPLEAVADPGEAARFKATGMDKDAGTFTVEDPNSKSRIAVKLDGQALHVTSRNPHHRLANEYRAYTKRESALTNSIADSEIVQ